MNQLERALTGCLLGTAVGDAMGLACEGLSRRRQAKMFPALHGYKFLFGKGMSSDDTEHTCMLAQSLLAHGVNADEQKVFANFAWRLRFWILGLPAGIGLATLRSIIKLWLGFPARMSGVFSAGNGPAMRCALLGIVFADDPARLRAMVRAATRITHTDAKAEYGAFAVALAAQLAARGADITPEDYLRALQSHIADAEFTALVKSAADSVASGESSAQFADSIGCGKGVSGYMYHTIPCVLHVWLTHQSDYRAAVTAMIRLGGDADTTAAIVGAIVGARTGKAGIPSEWLRDLCEWPRTLAWMEQLGARLAACASGLSVKPLWINPLGLLLRNLFFMIVVLLHGFRRMLPPY